MRLGLVALLAFALTGTAACGTLLGASGDDDEPVAEAADAGANDGSTSADGDASSTSGEGGGGSSDAGSEDTATPPCIGGSCPRWVFVTQKAWRGDEIIGTGGADGKCQAAGDAFKPGRQWKALLSDGIVNVSDRFTTSTSDYVTGNNLLVAQGWAGFLSPGHMKRIMDEANQPPPGDDKVWTNTQTDGQPMGADCSGWTALTGKGVHGNAGATDVTWLDNGEIDCVESAHLYCVEQ